MQGESTVFESRPPPHSAPMFLMRADKFLVFTALVVVGCSGADSTELATVPDTVAPILDRQWGALNGDVESAFTDIFGFTADDHGRLIVFDDGRGVRIYSPDGSFIRTLADQGEGPGEARFVQSIGSGAGLTVAWDQGNKRIYIWDRDFELVHATPTPRWWAAYDESAVNVLDNGEVWVKLAPDQTSHGEGFPRAEYLRVWPEPADTLFVDPGGAACGQSFDYTYRNGFWRDIREPWFPATISALGPSGEVYVGCNADFRFERIAEGVRTEFSRANRDLEIPSDERRFFETAWVPPIGSMPEFRPEFSRIVPGGDGKVWVFETSPAQVADVSEDVVAMSGFSEVLTVAERGGRFSVFDRTGTLVAIVPLPDDVRYSGYPTTRRVLIRGDTIWAVRTGRLDEQYIARYVVPFD